MCTPCCGSTMTSKGKETYYPPGTYLAAHHKTGEHEGFSLGNLSDLGRVGYESDYLAGRMCDDGCYVLYKTPDRGVRVDSIVPFGRVTQVVREALSDEQTIKLYELAVSEGMDNSVYDEFHEENANCQQYVQHVRRELGLSPNIDDEVERRQTGKIRCAVGLGSLCVAAVACAAFPVTATVACATLPVTASAAGATVPAAVAVVSTVPSATASVVAGLAAGGLAYQVATTSCASSPEPTD